MRLWKIITGVGIGLLGLILFFICSENVTNGYVGVIYNPLKGGVQDNVLTQGFNFKSPFAKVTEYSVATEQFYLSADKKEGDEEDNSFYVSTSDGKSVKVSIEYSMKFDSEKVANVFKRFRGQPSDYIFDTYVRGKIKTYVGEATSKYSVLDLYGAKRQEINGAIFKHVKTQFAKDFIIVDSTNLTDVQVDGATRNAIQQRVTAQQDLEKEKILRDKAVIVAEKLKIEAEGRANARAQEILISAKAQAEANRLQTQTLNDLILRKMEIEKWNGSHATIIGANTVIKQ